MSDQPTQAQPGVCDGKDHGVTAERLTQLRQEAQAFNQLLRVNEADAHGEGHEAAVREASNEFYKFLSNGPDEHHQSNGNRAFDASKAFYEQLAELPIGDRRTLAALAQEQNQSMTAADPAMPVLEVTLDSHAFIDDMTVKYPWPFSHDQNGQAKDYIAEFFTFHYMGMCAEFEAQRSPSSPGAPKPWLDIPAFGLGHQ